jgi:dephospho-CoA kinase
LFVVGITGGIGSGKSAVTSFIENRGINIVDADIVARQVVEPGSNALKQIEDHFGPDIISIDGSLDRAALRKIVFKAPEERQWLESLLHPLIRETILEQLTESKSPYAILSSPLLLETNQHELVNHIVVVDVPEETQIQRTTRRDDNSIEQVKAIISAQMPRQERLKHADSVISNDGDLLSLEQKVTKLHQQLLFKAQEESDD